MSLLDHTIQYIRETAKIPSFSSYEDRLHPYIRSFFKDLNKEYPVQEIPVKGNSLIFRLQSGSERTIALAAHLDKINHYGKDFPDELPVSQTKTYLEGAMDDSAGLGILLAMASAYQTGKDIPNLLFFFSEMEESKGLKEHPELIKNNGEGYQHGMGARRIARACIEKDLIPDEVITVDTTPLFKGEAGVALYSKHWEFNNLEASDSLKKQTEKTVSSFHNINPAIHLDNNTNDYLHYGYEFNVGREKPVISVALEPAIYPYHQKGERVFIDDIQKVLDILKRYIFEH